MKSLFQALLFLYLITFHHLASAASPPKNPFLADSPWPMSHQGPYAQGSSDWPGPTANQNLTNDYMPGLPVSITLGYTSSKYGQPAEFWGSSLFTIFNGEARDSGIHRNLFVGKPMAQNALSGAYIVVDKDDAAFIPVGDTSMGKFVHHKAPFLWWTTSQINKVKELAIPSAYINGSNDYIVGVNMTYDGHLIVVTANGVVCSTDRNLNSFDCINLPDNQEISNSIAVDEEGGIYIVSNKYMNRIQWTGSSLSTHSSDGAWQANYETGPEQPLPGRLGTGSGSTPSLMGNQGEDQFVVVTDGQELAHLVLFWRSDIPADWQPIAPGKDRRIAAEVPIKFGNPSATSSVSEQSVLVRDHSAMVVSNDYAFSSSWLPGLLQYTTVFFSNVGPNAPYGVERFSWDKNTRTVKSDWATKEISCPNGIPTMSAATQLAYCIGQRGGKWTLEGINWQTGASAFHYKLGLLPINNSFYAATQIGADGDIITGTFGGVVRIRQR
ncbi:hypothetical protein CS022_05670 [Veronia nyctiphanis]|uniref:Uncharacterized protein n=1 Tax=Veronia nyctiphanis TaxID=1278244 RepID=A0A4Q0YTQ2_9GAMM|nr:hypothetical protein [Veronia nyctiphanis]RXJ74115.1 hypothetical protein CS022_05670 [Veronia nyctiphanis]